MNPKSDGRAFPNRRKTAENHPDMTGWIDITPDQVRKLIEMQKAGQEMKLQLGIWKRQAKESGQPYLYMSVEAYMKQEQKAKDFIDEDIPF